jgi:hypothetical protein
MDPNRRAWSLMTRSRGGTVSILRDLTLAECRQSYERLDPEFGCTTTLYERSQGSEEYHGRGRVIVGREADGEIVQREVFGPDDWDRKEMEEWPRWPKRECVKWEDPQHERHWLPGLQELGRAFADSVKKNAR